MTDEVKDALLGLSLQELTSLAEDCGEPGYRGQQLFQALYAQRAEHIEQISTLPLGFRSTLAQRGFSMGLPVIDNEFCSRDGTIRYLMLFGDGQSVETVWMPDGDGGEAGDGTEAGNEIERQ
jgi:23S rRNA (adenine2503-C2)-methyltransferase